MGNWILDNPELFWFFIGLVFMLMELGIPDFVLLFFGVGAWITSLLSYFDLSITTQVVIFIVGSLLSLILLRKYIERLFFSEERPSSETFEYEFLGNNAIADTDILPGKGGKVTFKGTQWIAYADEEIPTGTLVRITGKESINLFVQVSNSN